MSQELIERARAWVAADPDPTTRHELQTLIDSGTVSELTERFQAELDFGTAGLRGEVGAGPARMNRAVVMRATRALADHLAARTPDARSLPVVIGFDARLTSRALAEAAAGVMLAAGFSVRWFDAPVPTPLVCYAARAYAAAAALVVTASHNPKRDNGLKVYGSDARQLVAPDDVDVARRRELVGGASEIACVEFTTARATLAEGRFQVVPSSLAERYLDEVEALLPSKSAPRKLRIVYTPIHGVGLELARAALTRRGFTDVHVVAEQAKPDGTFPTAEFPNPELDGVLDRALALARSVNADIVLANDPDADRLAAAVRLPDAGWRVLTGNEVGILLADFVLAQAPAKPRPLLVTSIVSSPLLTRVAAAHEARCERTLTGFKWIWHAARTLEAEAGVRYAMGCEEALGYSIGPVVRDKDGISALLWLSELAERCRAEGKTLIDRLHEIFAEHGVWASAQVSLFNPSARGAEITREQVERLTRTQPEALGGLKVRDFADYRVAADERPAWRGASDVLELSLEDQCRVLVRPSGTEPKLKIYADAQLTRTAGESISAASERARQRARTLAEEMAAWLRSATSS
ncbi:MAG: phospho-sugar mutase [Myxococcota bacterium]